MDLFSKFAHRLNILIHIITSCNMAGKSIGFLALGVLLRMVFNFTILQVLLSIFVIYTVTGGWRFLWIIYKTGPRDFKALIYMIKSKKLSDNYTKKGENIPSLFQKTVPKHPNKTAFIAVDGNKYTFQQVEDLSNQVANYFLEAGFKHGDVVVIFMESSPEYVCMWLGLTKIGVIPALVNFNLRMDSLVHCINISEAKAVIYSVEYTMAIKEITHLLPSGLRMYGYTTTPSNGSISVGEHLNPFLEQSSKMAPPKNIKMGFNDKLFYIYTSGTTGLPKAAIIINSRFYYMVCSVHHFNNLTSDDVLYDALPLYHTAGGILGVGQCLLHGMTVVIRKKFSASRFWDDCVKYQCTVTQYIGEICRYLLAQPNKPGDSQNRVRVAFGNGLRPQIWKQFMERFRIESIGEFYGATEGNANLINPDSTFGAVGFTTRIVPSMYPVKLVKVDENGKLLRGRNGLCLNCSPGEPGELVGKIIKGDTLRQFDGYVNKEATQKKIGYDIFTKGDRAFLTGDVLVMDNFGYFFFKDRTGDTFRWKGENVSTFEVEAQISKVIQVDVAVYGVEIPNMDGRAGMAAIADVNVDIPALYSAIQKSLPPYARPVFIRLLEKVDLTGTHKIKKTEHQKEGFNPDASSDSMFYLDAKKGGYRALDKQAYKDIINGDLRF